MTSVSPGKRFCDINAFPHKERIPLANVICKDERFICKQYTFFEKECSLQKGFFFAQILLQGGYSLQK